MLVKQSAGMQSQGLLQHHMQLMQPVKALLGKLYCLANWLPVSVSHEKFWNSSRLASALNCMATARRFMRVHLKQIVWLALQDRTRPDPVSLLVSKYALQVMRHLRHPSVVISRI